MAMLGLAMLANPHEVPFCTQQPCDSELASWCWVCVSMQVYRRLKYDKYEGDGARSDNSGMPNTLHQDNTLHHVLRRPSLVTQVLRAVALPMSCRPSLPSCEQV